MTFREFCEKHGCTDKERRELWTYYAFIKWLESVRIAAGLCSHCGEDYLDNDIATDETRANGPRGR